MRRTAVLILLGAWLPTGCRDAEPQSVRLDDLIREDAARDGPAAPSQADWERVVQPRAFEFPRDHAAHPDHRIEWWY